MKSFLDIENKEEKVKELEEDQKIKSEKISELNIKNSEINQRNEKLILEIENKEEKVGTGEDQKIKSEKISN